MGCLSCILSTKFLITLLLISAIPIGILIALERAPPSTHVYEYHSNSWFRECAKWDDVNRHFIVSYIEGGVGVINVPHEGDVVYDEITAVKDADLAGNASLGITIDRPRNRVLVAVADAIGNRYSALAAYDLSSWQRLFLAHLSGPDDEKSMADDVAVDGEGNAYVTDVKASKIWKVNKDGKVLSIIRSPLFSFKEWYKNIIALNGIVYHPDGYLLVIHTTSGTLYKIDLNKGGQSIKLVKIVSGSLLFGDGLELLSPSKLVVAGKPSGQLLESSDGWETASVVGKFWGPGHRLATATTVKDGKVYLSYLVGLGYPKRKHVLVEAMF
ncbi:hypothetical protein RND81_10G249200 [Saponaria officinalis]|uniref:SMP-30/Gluconolactonase/LRE-like region domain-containing protein n=1 Tax=Saponaria officinalis TaxID=3572 RepID=A0AAW1I687_SAPOF